MPDHSNSRRHRVDPRSRPDLALPVDDIAAEIAPPERPGDRSAEPDLAATADRFVVQTLGLKDTDAAAAGREREAIDGFGMDAQRDAAHRSARLDAPLRTRARQSNDNGPVAHALNALRRRVQTLDPNRNKRFDGPLAGMLAFIPGLGTPLQRYFQRFESAQQDLDTIIRNLESGRDMLRRDNLTLADDQQALRNSLDPLERGIALGRLIDSRLEAAAGREQSRDRRVFIEHELCLPLRQRVVDLQQQLAVSQQGVLALEVVIRNNRELIRGVDRALHVTVAALNVAVATAHALGNQRLVLDRIDALNRTTSQAVADTAGRLCAQSAEVRQRRASASLDLKQLERAFTEVIRAIDDVSSYRHEALPRLDVQIDRLDALAHDGDATAAELEPGHAGRSRGAV